MGTLKYNLPFKEYLTSPGISCSQLKYIIDCPQKYKYYVLDGNEKKDTEAMRIGRAFHALMLEPEVFEADYFVTPKVNCATKLGKAEWAEALLNAGKKEILLNTDCELLQDMKKAVLSNDGALTYLNGIKQGATEKLQGWKDKGNEVSMFWKDGDIKCRSRIDAIRGFGNKIALIDIKSAVAAKHDLFSRNVFKYRYDVQAAYYMDGYEAITGIMPEIFVFIVVEKTAPHLVSLSYITPNSETYGSAKADYQQALDKLVRCTESGEWSETYGPARPLLRPAYM